MPQYDVQMERDIEKPSVYLTLTVHGQENRAAARKVALDYMKKRGTPMRLTHKELAKDHLMVDLPLDQYFAALDFAAKAHQGQKRKKSGDPYIVHPMRVAQMLTLGDTSTIVQPHMVVAAILHDVVEDTEVTQADIYKEFDYAAAVLVEVLTKDPKQTKGEYVRGVIEHSLEASLIKVADRLDNLRDAAKAFEPKKLAIYLEGTSDLLMLAKQTWGYDLTTTDLFMQLEDTLSAAYQFNLYR